MPSNLIHLQLPFRSTGYDHCLEWTSRLIGSALYASAPRRSVAVEQMRLIGLTPTSSDVRRLYTHTTRELLRIITHRFNRLDLTALEALKSTFPGPVLFLSFHIGNWEWLAALLTRQFPRVQCVVRGVRNPHVQRWVLHHRRKLGLKVLVDHEALRSGKQHLSQAGFLAFLCDQRPPGTSRPGQWLGFPTAVSSLPEWWSDRLTIPPTFLTGALIGSQFHYDLRLDPCTSPFDASNWDHVLDQYFLPLILKHPWAYPGWWHRRLHEVSRET